MTPLNRLRNVRHNGTLVVRYGYDVLGRRIAKPVYSGITGGTVGFTRYKYHGSHVAFETDSAGSNIGWRYTWGMGTDDLLALRDAAGNHYYTAKDKLGSIRALAERDGTWKYSTRYGPYGEPKTGAGTDPGLRYRWTGREYDTETGWYFHRSRYYAPTMLRFVQEDKIGYGGGANLYAYVGGAVLNARDPDGALPVYEKYMWCYECMQGGESWADSFMWIGSILPVQVTYVMLGDRRIGRIDASIGSVLEAYDAYVNAFSAEQARQINSKRTIELAIKGKLTGLTLKNMFEAASALSAGEFGALIGRWAGFGGSRGGSGVLAQRGAMGLAINSRLAHGTIFHSASFVNEINQIHGSTAVGWTGSIYTALGTLSSKSIVGAVVHESLHYLGYPGSEGQVWERTNIIMGSNWTNPWGW